MIPDNYECDGQLDIFDVMSTDTDIRTMDESDIMQIISQRIGGELRYDEFFGDYRAKVGRLRIECELSTYMDSDVKCILVGYTLGNGNGGGGSCDSIDEAVEYFRKKIKGEQNGKKTYDT